MAPICTVFFALMAIITPVSLKLFGGFEHWIGEIFEGSRNPSALPPPCRNAQYTTHLLSTDPLVIYIESFIQAEEIPQLLQLADGKYEQTPTYNFTHAVGVDPTIRDSVSFRLPVDDKLTRCIENRAYSFQGFPLFVQIETPKLQRYFPGGHYIHHYDWFENHPIIQGNRFSTFMVYLEANCSGGGTNFPQLSPPLELLQPQWCDFIDCEESTEGGVTFKPIPGNGIYWHNLHRNGTGHAGTFHAALPVTAGMKTGMNIWSYKTFDTEWNLNPELVS